MKGEELNAIIKVGQATIAVAAIIIGLLLSVPAAIVLLCVDIFMLSSMPMSLIRITVNEKDMEIKENFVDFYLMLHYVLLERSGVPLTTIMRQYARTTDSEEMIRLVDCCVHHMETRGEYSGTTYITADYREIAEIGKLMRLIRQTYDGGDVEAELNNFIREVLDNRKYALSVKKEKIVNKARRSLILLMPILVQAIISSMAIYMDDLGVGLDIFSGM